MQRLLMMFMKRPLAGYAIVIALNLLVFGIFIAGATLIVRALW